MQLLAQDRFTIEDVGHERPVTSYNQSVTRHVKGDGFDTVFSQRRWAWNHVAPALRCGISMPRTETTKLDFIRQLDDTQSRLTGF